jgi:hypothetical protein
MTTTTEHDVIRCEVDADGIALLTIDYPGKTMNVIDQAFIDSLQRGIDRVAGDAAIKGAIVTSGKEAFVAGADLLAMEANLDQTADDPVDGAVREVRLAVARCSVASRPAASRSSRRSTARRWAEASSSRSPATTACWPTSRRPRSACPRCRSACCRAPAARSGCRG